MTRAFSLIVAGIVVGMLTVSAADAGQTTTTPARPRVQVRPEVRDDRFDRSRVADRYFRDSDVVTIRAYYRPFYRPVPPGLQRNFVRAGYLPSGWDKRIRPLPSYVERELVPIPTVYHRGIIDGWAVVYNDRGFILDVVRIF